MSGGGMKLGQNCEGTWVLKHRPYFSLCLSLIFLSIIPSSIISGRPDWVKVCIFGLLFGSLCLWGFAEFATVEISSANIRYKRNLLLYTQEVCKSRSSLMSICLEVSPCGRSKSKRIKFTFSDGESIVIPKAFVGSTIGWSINDIYQSLKEILPDIKQDSGDAILSLISNGNIVKAITLVRREYGMGLTEAKQFVEELRSNKSLEKDGLEG